MPINIQQIEQSSFLITWKNEINPNTSREIYHFNKAILKLFPDLIIDSVPAYCSLTLYVNHGIAAQLFIDELLELYENTDFYTKIKSSHWEIPVCYHPSLGLDLISLSRGLNFSVEKIISLHSTPIYTVDFIGFLPGFPYLSGLNKKLHAPRLSSPRVRVKKGSIGIGSNQTGIYPLESPAGWNLIGNTPIDLFDSRKPNPCLLSPMDTLKFIPISLSQYHSICAND